MFPPNYSQIPMPSNGGNARVMTQQPENFSGIPPAAVAEAARQQQAAAEAQARDSEKRFLAVLQQTVDNRLQGLGAFLEQSKERIESLERGLAETMAYVQTLTPNSGSPLSPAEHRVLLLVQSQIMTRDEARQVLGLGTSPAAAIVPISAKLHPKAAPSAEKRKPGRPRKATPPPIEAEVLKELASPEA